MMQMLSTRCPLRVLMLNANRVIRFSSPLIGRRAGGQAYPCSQLIFMQISYRAAPDRVRRNRCFGIGPSVSTSTSALFDHFNESVCTLMIKNRCWWPGEQPVLRTDACLPSCVNADLKAASEAIVPVGYGRTEPTTHGRDKHRNDLKSLSFQGRDVIGF